MTLAVATPLLLTSVEVARQLVGLGLEAGLADTRGAVAYKVGCGLLQAIGAPKAPIRSILAGYAYVLKRDAALTVFAGSKRDA